MSCEMVTTPMSEVGRYKCLSYVWGNTHPRGLVIINGLRCEVTPNLYSALDCLRSRGLAEPVWIDALCINQRDEVEKMEQVALMGDIFSRAAEVLVWLGKTSLTPTMNEEEQAEAGARTDEGDISEAVEFLYELASGKHFHMLPHFVRCGASHCPSELEQPLKSWKATLQSLEVLMDAPWFERTWTIQLANRATVLYDHHCIPWNLIIDAWVQWNKHLNSCCGECIFTLDLGGFQALHLFAGRILDFENAKRSLLKGQCMLHPLLKFKSIGTSYPRDKIYGLLGLQDGRMAVPVTPDYSISVVEVFTKFAAELISSQKWVVPLHLSLSQALEGLPSCVSDWTYKTTDPSDYGVAQLTAASSYNCADGFEGAVKIVHNTVLDGPGIEVDTITQLSAAYHLKRSPVEQLALVGDWHQFFDLEGRGDELYVGGGTIRHAFFRTVFGDRFHEGNECRQLRNADIADWQAHLKDTTRRLRENGPNATLELHPSMSSHVIACLRRRLFMTSKGYIGVCPDSCRIGDKVFVLCLCLAPIFLRHGRFWWRQYLQVCCPGSWIRGRINEWRGFAHGTTTEACPHCLIRFNLI